MQDGRYAVVTDRWQKFTDVYLDQEVLNFLAGYADEFLVHGVDVEGKKYGLKLIWFLVLACKTKYLSFEQSVFCL